MGDALAGNRRGKAVRGSTCISEISFLSHVNIFTSLREMLLKTHILLHILSSICMLNITDTFSLEIKLR